MTFRRNTNRTADLLAAFFHWSEPVMLSIDE